MGNADSTITLYCDQSAAVREILFRDGVCFCKREYIEKKYGESAPVFLAAYDWFVAAAPAYLPPPAGAAYPYWAFAKRENLEAGDALTLRVPASEAIFFDMYDWIKVLRLQFLGENEAQVRAFRESLAARGVRRESDVFLTNFYPDLKREVQQSWMRLFRHDAAIRAGNVPPGVAVQAALWQLKREWAEEKA